MTQVSRVIGKVIQNITMNDKSLTIHLNDSSHLTISDDAQYCCEKRYMTTDDKLADFVDAKFMGIEVRDGGSTLVDGWMRSEIEFLLINTSIGTFTIENHNEHNGYYGGFDITTKVVVNR